MATAVIGGTGALGRGVATRFASIGEPVVIGSRDAARAAAAAAELNALVGRDVVSGAANAEAAAAGEIVFVCVPFAAQDETLQAIRAAVAGKIVVEGDRATRARPTDGASSRSRGVGGPARAGAPGARRPRGVRSAPPLRGAARRAERDDRQRRADLW